MKKLVLFIALFSTLPLFAQKFGAFEIIDKGAIEIQSNCMQAEFGGDYHDTSNTAKGCRSNKKHL